MDLSEALQRCVILSSAKINGNCSPEIDATLQLIIDPGTVEGEVVVDWLNELPAGILGEA